MAGEKQRRSAALVAVTQRRVAEGLARQRAAKVANQRPDEDRGAATVGKQGVQGRAGRQRLSGAVAFELAHHRGHFAQGAPALEGGDHRRLCAALWRAVHSQRRDRRVDSHRRGQARPPPGGCTS